MEAHNQILLITLMEEFMDLNVNRNTITKKVQLVEINTRIANAFLNTQSLKRI